MRVEWSPHGEYMFGLLGYSTWNIYNGKDFVGQITLNGVDHSALWTPNVEGLDVADMFQARSFTWWMRWLRHNRQDPF